MNPKLVLYVIVAVMVTITLGTGTMVLRSYASQSGLPHFEPPPVEEAERKAPTVIPGDNVYIVWFTNEGNKPFNLF